MAIEFHRLNTPTYFGALPATHDYINYPAGNTPPDPGTPAAADGKKSSGVNEGSYFIAYEEDVTDSNANRANLALAENCDYLDDVVHRDLGTPSLKTVVLAGVSEFVLPGEIFVGMPGTTFTANGRNMLVVVYKDWSGTLIPANALTAEYEFIPIFVNGIENGSGASVLGDPTAAGGDEDGFFTDPTIKLDQSLTGTFYVFCYERSNAIDRSPGFATLLEQLAIPPATLWAAIQNNAVCGPSGGLPDWKDTTSNPAPVTVDDQIKKIITDLVADAGAARIGGAASADWHDSTANGADSIQGKLDKIITDLVADKGSDRIGSDLVAGSHINLPAGQSIYDHLQIIANQFNATLDVLDNTWGGKQTFNGSGSNAPILLTPKILSLSADGEAGIDDIYYAKVRLDGEDRVFATPKSPRSFFYPIECGIPRSETNSPYAPDWVVNYTAYKPIWTSSNGIAQGVLIFGLNRFLHDGATLTRVRARVKPGSALSDPNAMFLGVWKRAEPNGAVTPLKGPIWDNGGIGEQWLDATAIAETLDTENNTYFVVISGGSNGGTYDYVYCLEVFYSEGSFLDPA